MRSAWLICLVAGCGFSGAAAPADDDPGTGPDPGDGSGSQTGVAAPPAASLCDVTDPTLRLCLTFDQPGSPLAQDLVAPPHAITEALNVASATGMAMPAMTTNTAARFAQSHIQFANSGDFDLAELTLEMWLSPMKPKGPPVAGVLLDRDGKYTATYDASGAIRCSIGGLTAVSHDSVDNGWHHIACRYDPAAAEVRVYLDGSVAGCSKPPAAIPVGVTAGLVIGASHVGPAYQNPFSGMIDGVHLYARVRGDAEICSAAGKAACATSCDN